MVYKDEDITSEEQALAALNRFPQAQVISQILYTGLRNPGKNWDSEASTLSTAQLQIENGSVERYRPGQLIDLKRGSIVEAAFLTQADQFTQVLV